MTWSRRLGFAVLALLCLLTVGADYALTRNRAEAPGQMGATALVAGLAGQFRSVLAGALWVKADAYHHEFIKHNPHWSQNTEIVPMMRAVTVLDPHFTQAYAAGAWMMGLYQNKPAEAREFLREGIRHNPRSAELYEILATLSWKCDHDLAAAVGHLRKARSCAATRWDRQRLDRSIAKIEKQLALDDPSKNPG